MDSKNHFWIGPALQESVLDGNRSTESTQIQQKRTKSGNFGNMLSFTDCLISFECVFIQCLGARLGSQSGIAGAILNQNGFQPGNSRCG